MTAGAEGTRETMRFVIVDLEATCWKKNTEPSRMEIIEIGAVLLSSARGPVAAEFSRFVRPVAEPRLSDFCKELTGVRQSEVDSAEPFQRVFRDFMAWIGEDPFTWCSWGAYDQRQLRTDCGRHGIPFPEVFESHVNLKRAFADRERIRPCGMTAALRRLKLPLEGRHHRAIDDARNIAKIAQTLLPDLEGQSEMCG